MIARVLLEIPVVRLDLLQAKHVEIVSAQPLGYTFVLRLDVLDGRQPPGYVPTRQIQLRHFLAGHFKHALLPVVSRPSQRHEIWTLYLSRTYDWILVNNCPTGDWGRGS